MFQIIIFEIYYILRLTNSSSQTRIVFFLSTAQDFWHHSALSHYFFRIRIQLICKNPTIHISRSCFNFHSHQSISSRSLSMFSITFPLPSSIQIWIVLHQLIWLAFHDEFQLRKVILWLSLSMIFLPILWFPLRHHRSNISRPSITSSFLWR
jgi:hypothetical protein